MRKHFQKKQAFSEAHCCFYLKSPRHVCTLAKMPNEPSDKYIFYVHIPILDFFFFFFFSRIHRRPPICRVATRNNWVFHGFLRSTQIDMPCLLNSEE